MASQETVSGPFIVAVSDWLLDDLTGRALSRVRLSGTGHGRTVLRRYSEFRALSRELRRTRSERRLPALPPRGLLLKRLPGFMQRRRQGLGTFLAAALAADPHCVDTPVLRSFLGLPRLPKLSDYFDGCDADSTFSESIPGNPSWLSDLRLYPIAEMDSRDGTSCSGYAALLPAELSRYAEGVPLDRARRPSSAAWQ